MPLRPRISTITPPTGRPVLIETTKTSLVWSAFFFTSRPRSLTRMNRVVVTPLRYFFATGSHARALKKKSPRSLPPSAGFTRYFEKSKAE